MINRIFHMILTVLVTVSLLMPTVYAADSGAGTMTGNARTQLAPGLTYYERTYETDDDTPQVGRSIELSPDSSVYPIFMSCDTIWGGMTLSQCIQYAERLGLNVVGGINADFFNSSGVPIGLVIEGGVLESGNVKENAFAILSDGSYHVSRMPDVRITMTGDEWPEDTVYTLTRLNKKFGGNSLHLYTTDFSTVSTRVTTDVWAVRLKILEGGLTLSESVTLKVTEVLEETQAVPIGAGEMILTARKEGTYGQLYEQFAVGDQITLTAFSSDETLTAAVYAAGCGDILVENGKITDESTWTAAVSGANPRTLLGWQPDGTLVLTVMDGRRSGYAHGVTLRQAAEEMLRQGCVTAVNMDGGGSSIMSLRLPGQSDETVVNLPSDGWQRACGSYLLLVTDEQPDGVAKYLHLAESNLLIAAGQRLTLHPFATDTGLYPAVETGDVQLYSARGTIQDGVYTAPMTGGTDTITLWSSGAKGESSVRVVSSFTDVQITNRGGRSLDAVTLPVGESLDLHITASYRGQPVLADATAVRYVMSAPIGTVDDSGTFTASGLPGVSGDLILHLGSYTHTIHVTVAEASNGLRPTLLDTLRPA